MRCGRSHRLFTIVGWGVKAASVRFEKLGAALIIVMVLTITIESVVRTFFGFSTLISYDLTGLLLGPLVFLGLAESFRQGSHVRIRAAYVHFPQKVKYFLDTINCIIALVFGCIVLHYSLSLFLRSLSLDARIHSLVRLPLTPFQVILPLGALLFVVVMLLSLLSKIGIIPSGVKDYLVDPDGNT